MPPILFWLSAPLLTCLLLLLALRGGGLHPKIRELRRWRYAHRGLHGYPHPENSMAAFRAALEHGYGIELDIHLMADGNLAVIHDASLKRTTGQDACIEALTAQDLPHCFLEGTGETVPLFSSVLELISGKAPLIVELKTRNNAPALCRAACALLDSYPDALFCLESFDPRCLLWLRRHRPDLVRGQLAQRFRMGEAGPAALFRFLLGNHLLNFLTRPHFIAYRFRDRNTLATRICRRVWNIPAVSWTLRTREEYDTATGEGWIPIFESFQP